MLLPTPKVPSARGLVAHRAMEILGQLLWWYSWRIKQAFSSFARILRNQSQRQARINELLLAAHQNFAADLERIEVGRQTDSRELKSHLDRAIASKEPNSTGVKDLQADLWAKHGAVVDSLRRESDARQQLQSEVEALKDGLASTQRRAEELARYNQHLRSELTIQQARLSILLREARSPEPQPPSAIVSTRDLDALYVAFEDAFRGSRDEIKKRQSAYLPLLQRNEHIRPFPMLDIGCGRGEWLELLRDHGYSARGVDINDMMLDTCRDLGLAVEKGDGLRYLEGLRPSSLGLVTAFHVVEHLPFERVIDLIDQCLRVLVPGGLMILETPNPGNVSVGSQNFYMDPTHLKPVPSAMLRFFVEARGFTEVHIAELHPDPEALRLMETSEAARFLNMSFFGPRDYAVIGSKLR
jgi:SAM-dependent methyltransferase